MKTETLRGAAKDAGAYGSLLTEAADEIDRLREELATSYSRFAWGSALTVMGFEMPPEFLPDLLGPDSNRRHNYIQAGRIMRDEIMEYFEGQAENPPEPFKAVPRPE